MTIYKIEYIYIYICLFVWHARKRDSTLLNIQNQSYGKKKKKFEHTPNLCEKTNMLVLTYKQMMLL